MEYIAAASIHFDAFHNLKTPFMH